MTPSRFSDDELLALIEGDLPVERADALRRAVRDGDLELAGRLIDMAEHRDFLREMKIDRADLNPDRATTPEGIVAAAIAAAERESLVPAPIPVDSGKRAWWIGPFAAAVSVAALIVIGIVISNDPVSDSPSRLPDDIEDQIARGDAKVVGDENELPADLRDREALRRLAQDLFAGDQPDADDPDFAWPDIADNSNPSGIADPFEADPIELTGGSGLGQVLTAEDLASALAALEGVGVETGPDRAVARFAGVDPLGLEREFTLEEAAALAKSGRLAIEIDERGAGGFALAGGYLADAHQRYSVFAAAPGTGGPEEIEQLRTTERVTGLTGRVGEALGSVPRALASYSFEAAGSRNRVNDIERATMLELIAAVVSPQNNGPNGSRIRLIELPFDASDEPSIGSSEAENPFWWLQPETDYSQRGTSLIPVMVK